MTKPLALSTRNGQAIPRLGFGLMGMSYEVYGSYPSDEERFNILDRAHELGSSFWDSSDLYGDSEELLAKWFKRSGKRDDIFLATKFGFVKGSKSHEVDSSAKYCIESCDRSLKILGVDSIDLYYLHSANPNTPIEETMRAMAQLKAQGKIRHIGLSSVSSATLRRAMKIAPVSVVQTEYSPFTLAIENSDGTNLLATCRELGVTIVAAMPLGRGMITSTFANGEAGKDPKDMRIKMMPRFLDENRHKNEETVRRFRLLAEKKGHTASQLALVWLLKQGDDIIPIPGTKKLKYLEENWASLKVQLTDEDEVEVRNFLSNTGAAGSNLPPQFQGYDFKDTVEEHESNY